MILEISVYIGQDHFNFNGIFPYNSVTAAISGFGGHDIAELAASLARNLPSHPPSSTGNHVQLATKLPQCHTPYGIAFPEENVSVLSEVELDELKNAVAGLRPKYVFEEF